VGIKLLCKFKAGKMGWDMYSLRLPIFGSLVEKNTLARTTRTLGTLVSSGVPILEALNITRETAGNAVFERMYGKVSDSIREGETIAKPLKEFSKPGFHPMALTLWILTFTLPLAPLVFIPGLTGIMVPALVAGAVVGGLFYMMKMNKRVVDDLVVNMVDVGEETGELDTMLYKVADTFDDEVSVITSSLTKLMEPLLIIFLGGAVGFIVIALFLPLIKLIQTLS
jgi:type IV pilus assembly protein PilC